MSEKKPPKNSPKKLTRKTALPVLAQPRNPHCRACEFGETAITCCLPLHKPDLVGSGNPDTAVLVVGEAPGRNEDETGIPFIGQSGQILRSVYLTTPGVTDRATIYFANSVRCRPPGNATPKPAHVRACRPYLLHDIQELARLYPRLAVLCVGATAVKATRGGSLRDGLRHQGDLVDFGGVSLPCFYTYHPAYLIRRRDPAKVAAVSDHVSVLLRWLDGDPGEWNVGDIPLPTRPDPTETWEDITGPVTLDIETYGAVAGNPAQTQFNPRKMVAVDGIRPSSIVQTIGIHVHREGNPDPTNHLFVASERRDMESFRKLLVVVRRKRLPILGFNLKFDIQVLRFCFPALAEFYLHPDKQQLIDVSVLSFLHSDVRPERSLKDLSLLFNVTYYTKTAKNTVFDSVMDPALWRYNIQDCIATRRLYDMFLSLIARDYGDDSPKLSPYAFRWWSDQIWTAILLEETGVAVDVSYLGRMLATQTARGDACINIFRERYDRPLSGPGSGKTASWLLEEGAAVANLGRTKILEKTEKTGRLSTKDPNLELVRTHLPVGHPLRNGIRLLQSYRTHMKLCSSYLNPLLYGRGVAQEDKRSAHVKGIVYPSWYISPSAEQTNNERAEEEGGTVQCRMTAQRPGLQTNPPSIKGGFTSRFSPGFLLAGDLSQIELRVPGVLSGDPRILAEYAAGIDRHLNTARLVFGDDFMDTPHLRKMYRQVGKVLNFLMLFRGSAAKFRRVIWERFQLRLPTMKCQEAIDAFWTYYPVLRAWQDDLIAEAIRTKVISVPLVGASRTFAGSDFTLRSTYDSTICNLQVQAVAALIMESAHTTILREFRRRRLRSVSGLQIYDALYIDGPVEEEAEVKEIVQSTLKCPPYYRDLCDLYGRTVPLETEFTTKYVGSLRSRPSGKRHQKG